MNVSDEKTESDNITALELQKTKRTLYFSDGTLEELSDSESEDIAPDVTDRCINESVQMDNLPLGSRIKYHAYVVGCQLLNGVDYIGEGLASFFGITSSKYLSESDIENAMKSDIEVNDLDNISHNNEGWGWNHNNVDSTKIDVTRFSQTTVNNCS